MTEILNMKIPGLSTQTRLQNEPTESSFRWKRYLLKVTSMMKPSLTREFRSWIRSPRDCNSSSSKWIPWLKSKRSARCSGKLDEKEASMGDLGRKKTTESKGGRTLRGHQEMQTRAEEETKRCRKGGWAIQEWSRLSRNPADVGEPSRTMVNKLQWRSSQESPWSPKDRLQKRSKLSRSHADIGEPCRRMRATVSKLQRGSPRESLWSPKERLSSALGKDSHHL